MQQGAGRRPFRARLRVDGTFNLELQFCNEHGLPHSEFLQWDPVDRSKALAYLMEASERCQLCGTSEWEWNENKHAYEPVTRFCKGCYVKAAASEGDSQHGMTWELAPTGTIEAAQRAVREAANWRQDRNS